MNDFENADGDLCCYATEGNNQPNSSVFVCTVNGRKIGPVHKVPVMKLMLQGSIEQHGEKKLEQKDLVNLRLRKKERIKHYSHFLDGVLNKILTIMPVTLRVNHKRKYSTSLEEIVQELTFQTNVFLLLV